MANSKKRVLSGIRATGRLHLGNYLGMVKGMIGLQESKEYEPFFMVADLHAMTTPYDPESLRRNVREVVLDYLAAGLNPEKASVFVQSLVREHVELAYLFSTVVSIARLSHLPTYKEKVKQYPENNTLALLYYPVLMASDILLYKTQALPVGDDQLPHLEIAREIAKKMNEKYGTDFPEPQQMKTEGHYVPSLTGEGKMSKSVEVSYINLTDSLEEIKRKLAKVPTDSGTQRGSIPEIGGVRSLYVFYKLYFPDDFEELFEKPYKSGRIRYDTIKNSLAERIYNELVPIQEKRRVLEAKPEHVDKVLIDGAEKARKIAQLTLEEVKEKMGLK